MALDAMWKELGRSRTDSSTQRAKPVPALVVEVVSLLDRFENNFIHNVLEPRRLDKKKKTPGWSSVHSETGASDSASGSANASAGTPSLTRR